MNIKEILNEIAKHDGAVEGHDYILAFFYQIGMPPPTDEFVKSLITAEKPNPNFWEVRSRWIVKWAKYRFEKQDHTIFLGPCVHGHDPWDRCDECGEGSALEAAAKRINQLVKDNHNITNSNKALSSRLEQEITAMKWLKKSAAAGELEHQDGCGIYAGKDCDCGMTKLLKE